LEPVLEGFCEIPKRFFLSSRIGRRSDRSEQGTADAFSEMREYHLTVCGPIDGGEQDFVRAYDRFSLVLSRGQKFEKLAPRRS